MEQNVKLHIYYYAKYFLLGHFISSLNYGISASMCEVYSWRLKVCGMFWSLNYFLVSVWKFPVLLMNMIPSISLKEIFPTVLNFAITTKGPANEQYQYHPLYMLLLITGWFTSKCGFLSRYVNQSHKLCANICDLPGFPCYLKGVQWSHLLIQLSERNLKNRVIMNATFNYATYKCQE